MANYVGNILTIKCQDPDIMDRIKKMILRTDEYNNTEFTMEILLPRSMAFANEDTYDEYWNLALWGTDRDVRDYDIIMSGGTLTLVYDTAWCTNKGWIEALCCYLHQYLLCSPKKNTCNLEIEHRYSDYQGNFGGHLFWRPGLGFSYKDYDSYMEYLKNTDFNAYQYMLEVEKEMKSDRNSAGRVSIPI